MRWRAFSMSDFLERVSSRFPVPKWPIVVTSRVNPSSETEAGSWGRPSFCPIDWRRKFVFLRDVFGGRFFGFHLGCHLFPEGLLVLGLLELFFEFGFEFLRLVGALQDANARGEELR